MQRRPGSSRLGGRLQEDPERMASLSGKIRGLVCRMAHVNFEKLNAEAQNFIDTELSQMLHRGRTMQPDYALLRSLSLQISSLARSNNSRPINELKGAQQTNGEPELPVAVRSVDVRSCSVGESGTCTPSEWMDEAACMFPRDYRTLLALREQLPNGFDSVMSRARTPLPRESTSLAIGPSEEDELQRGPRKRAAAAALECALRKQLLERQTTVHRAKQAERDEAIDERRKLEAFHSQRAQEILNRKRQTFLELRSATEARERRARERRLSFQSDVRRQQEELQTIKAERNRQTALQEAARQRRAEELRCILREKSEKDAQRQQRRMEELKEEKYFQMLAIEQQEKMAKERQQAAAKRLRAATFEQPAAVALFRQRQKDAADYEQRIQRESEQLMRKQLDREELQRKQCIALKEEQRAALSRQLLEKHIAEEAERQNDKQWGRFVTSNVLSSALREQRELEYARQLRNLHAQQLEVQSQIRAFRRSQPPETSISRPCSSFA